MRLGLHPDLLKGLKDLGFTRPTAIQADAIPLAMAGGDVLACAMTGSGKIQKYLLREEAERRATLRSSSEPSDAGSPGHEADRLVAGIASNRPGDRA